MSKKQETVADIVAELRQEYKARPPINRAETTWERRRLADRIEAAYKRDIEAYDLINFMSPVGRAEPAPVGNDAKMREALEQIASIPMPPPIHLAQQCAREMREKAIAALAEPPRECDVGTAEEQAQRFNDYCKKQGDGCCIGKGKGACPIFKGYGVDCGIVWAQMPYEEGGEAE